MRGNTPLGQTAALQADPRRALALRPAWRDDESAMVTACAADGRLLAQVCMMMYDDV